VCHMFYSSGFHLSIVEGSEAPFVLWILPPYREGSGAAIVCSVASCESRVSNIKKSLTGLPVQLGMHVPNTHAYIFKAFDVRIIMGLQDVRVASTVNVCKTCG
jgi:hypothetical protein